MKILHVLDHSIPLHSGYTFRTRAILKEQRKRGWKTSHITSSKQGQVANKKETIDGLTFYRTREHGGLWKKLPVIDQFLVARCLSRRLREVIALEDPDIVHAHSPCLTGLAALGVCKELGLPLVYEMRASWEDAAVSHGTTTQGSLRYKLTRGLETYVLRRADAITAICEGLRGDISSRDIDPEKITIIPNAVEAEKFTFQKPPDRLLAQQLRVEGKAVIGFVGSFYNYEGLHLLIEAVAMLREQLPQVHLLLVGGGPDEQALRSQVSSLNLGAHVTFTGRVPHEDVPRYYSVIDILAYPRLPIRLTEIVTPLKPLEAMAMGKVLVASDIGGHRELIRSGETGYLFTAGDIDALASCILEVWNGRQGWDELLKKARHFVESERTWARSVANYEGVYRKLIS